MIILDSNVWIAFFAEDDSQHEKAVQIFIREPKITVTEYCVLETATILINKTNEDVANRFLDHITENEDVEILYSSQHSFQETMRVFREKNGKKLSAIDASLLYLSMEHEVITFDKDLEKAIKKHTKRHAKSH